MDLAEIDADNKKYNGHDYSLYLELNDANRFTYKHPGHDITLCGVDMTLPDSYTKLTQTGLTPDDEDDAAKKTIRYSDFINYKDGKGNRIKAELNDDSGKEVPIEKSLVEKLDFEKANYGTEDRSISVDFNYRGVTSKSSVQDVIKALGSPSELEMTVNEVGVTNSSFVIITLHYYAYQSTGAFTSTNFHTHEETHYISDGGCSIQFYYYPSEKKSVMTSFSLEYESE